MSKLILAVLLFFPNLVVSQFVNTDFPVGAVLGPITNSFSSLFTKMDDGFIKLRTNPKKNEIKGSIYIFEKWTNQGSIYVDKKRYRLGNVNFNTWTNTIESQVGKDSIYVFDLSNVNYATINKRTFKSFYFSKKNKNQIFELMYNGDDFQILIDYEIEIKRGEVDPLMVKRRISKYFTTKIYYFKHGININRIVLKKKNVLPLFKEKAEIINKYVKDNKLSYKKDKDLKMIFNYYGSL